MKIDDMALAGSEPYIGKPDGIAVCRADAWIGSKEITKKELNR
jgi:hypothetical protein